MKMKRETNESMRSITIKGLAAILALAVLGTGWWLSSGKTDAAPNTDAALEQIYRKPAVDFDYNEAANIANLRQATGEQIAALNAFKTANNSPNATYRFNSFSGSPEMIYDFASQPLAGTPEEAGRAFLSQNAALFGISDLNNLRVFSNRAALGGHLIRFQQTLNDIPVKDGGIGIVMNANQQVVMASGPFFRNVAVSTQPTLSADQAANLAAADLNQFQDALPSHITNLLQTGLANLSQQAAVVSNLQPQLGIYPTANGYRLIWKVAKFSTNPFGLYLVSIDAHTGELVARKDFVDFQQAPSTVDVFPKYPTITDELKDQSIISNCNGTPCGQERVTLRSFDAQNRVLGLEGTLTGTHALVNNALATKQPFAQAALGTWHFRQNNSTGFEARTNEADQFSEPAEHQDEINAFFFVTYLVEYVDYLHVAGDRQNFGEGDLPNNYPNKTIPLPATVHIPNIYIGLDAAAGNLPNAQDPNLAQKVLGLDNAFALNVTSITESLTGVKSPIVANPTSYGHGFLFNDLALEGTVPYYEGMHAITSPIAGLEGAPEGGALNEGQADMWAFTITDNASLGDYVVNAKGFRQRYRDVGRDPNSVAYIRSARSTLKYGDIGTLRDRTTGLPTFEVHYDGEVYMSTMWDIREMMNRVYPNATTFKRPQPKDGLAQKPITQGTNIFERDFLGAMYVLGTTAPDTMVKARDAMIVADQMLYPSDATEPTAPGKNRAMIEQIFAAHELGVAAVEVTGGKATISTQVTPFAGDQAAPNVPSNVRLEAASPRSLKVSWNSVASAVSYEVLKRKIGFENVRQPNGRREFADGDPTTTGFRHVAFVSDNQLSYEDKGAVHEIFAPEGLSDLFNSEYVVCAVGRNTTGQLGFSNLSGATRANKVAQDLTAQVDTAISNIGFAGGVLSFDNKLTNTRGALANDKTIYAPIKFEISNISNPTVTVRNGDSGVNGFLYNQTLALGATSAAKRLKFNDPTAQIFSFDAKITGNAFTSSTIGTGSQNGDGSGNPPAPVVYSVFSETKTGTLAAGDPTATSGASATWGNPMFRGITWDDVPVTTKSDALFLDATLSSATAVDMDFDLPDSNGQPIASSAEHVSASVTPNTTYFLRVKGFANEPATYNIVSKQLLPNGSPNANAGTQTTGGAPGGTTTGITNLVRFTVNPLTRSVTFNLLTHLTQQTESGSVAAELKMPNVMH